MVFILSCSNISLLSIEIEASVLSFWSDLKLGDSLKLEIVPL